MFQHFRRAAENFKWPKNREDSSDLDDFLTESIAPIRTIFFEIFARHRRQKLHKTLEKLRKKLTTPSVPGRSVFGHNVIGLKVV